MKLQLWHLYTLLAFLLWGLWGFLPKIATYYVNEKSVIIWEGIGFILVTIVLFLTPGFKLDSDPKGIALSAFIGVVAILAELFFIYAVKQGKVSLVVPLTSLYPVLVLILAYIFLKEPITQKQLVGIIMALIAMILLI